MSKTKIVFISLGVLIAFIALAFILELGGLEWEKFFSPKKQSVKRQVFKQTRSYVEGKIQDLAKYRLEYMKATEQTDKDAIASTIRVMFAEFKVDKDFPKELATFLKQIRGY